MKILKFIINSLISCIIIIQGLIQLILNLNKIINSKYIIYQDTGGFGNTIIIPDFIRSMKNNNQYLYILFFEFGRHNKYTNLITKINQINIYTSLTYKQYRIGEYEGSKNNLAMNFIKDLINKIKKKNTKIFNNSQFFNYLVKKNKRKINNFLNKTKYCKNLNRLDFSSRDTFEKSLLIHILCKKNSKFELPLIYRDKITKKIPDYKRYINKCLTIYIRNRPQKSANKLNYNMIRNTNPKIFYKVCKYFIKLGWRINLIGDDYSNLVSKLNNHKNIIFAEKYNLNKKLFDIFSMTSSKLNITTQGGVNNLGFYSHMINVNIFPIGLFPVSSKAESIIKNERDFSLYQKIFCNGKIIKNNKDIRIFYKTNLQKKYKVKANTGDEIFSFCRSHYLRYIKKNKNF